MGRVRGRSWGDLPAETQSGWLFVHFSASLRLCGNWLSFLRHGIPVSPRLGGRDRRKRMSGASSCLVMSRVSRRDAETQSVWLDQRKIACSPAGCSVMRLAKNALDTASVQGKTQRLRREQQQPSAYANGSPLGGCLNAVDDTG